MGFPGGSEGKNPHAMQETWIQSLGWEYPLEKGMATLSSFLAWRIPWTEEPGGLQSMGLQRVRHDWSNLAHILDVLSNFFMCRFVLDSFWQQCCIGLHLLLYHMRRNYICLLHYWGDYEWWLFYCVNHKISSF